MGLGNRVSCAGIAEYSTHEDRPALLGNGQLEHADGKGLATYGEATNLTGARPYVFRIPKFQTFFHLFEFAFRSDY